MGNQPVSSSEPGEGVMLESRQETVNDDYIGFVAAGSRATGQYRCSECGYGITIHATLPVCPMCTGTTWEETTWSPLSNSPAFRRLHRLTPTL
jgi:rubrerythrin